MTEKRKEFWRYLRWIAILGAVALLGIGMWLTFGVTSCPSPF